MVFFDVQKIFKLDLVWLVYFCFCWLFLYCHIQEITAKLNVLKLSFPLHFLLECIYFCLMFRFLINFELKFVYGIR